MVVLDVVVVELVVDDVLEEVEQDVAAGARLQVWDAKQKHVSVAASSLNETQYSHLSATYPLGHLATQVLVGLR